MVAPHSYAIASGHCDSGRGAFTTYIFPLKQRPSRSRARVSCGVVVTRAIECHRYRCARRPANSASPRVVSGSGSKQITLTLGIFGAQTLPWPQYFEPREITTTGARCAHASPSTVSRRSPDPFIITIASTRNGIPCCGQTNNRAVAMPNPANMTKSAMTIYRRPLFRSLLFRRLRRGEWLRRDERTADDKIPRLLSRDHQSRCISQPTALTANREPRIASGCDPVLAYHRKTDEIDNMASRSENNLGLLREGSTRRIAGCEPLVQEALHAVLGRNGSAANLPIMISSGRLQWHSPDLQFG